MTLRGKKVVLAGRFKAHSLRQFALLLKNKGAKVTSRVTTRTDYVAVGHSAGSKEATARTLGRPIINEAQLMALLNGEEISLEDTPPPKDPSQAANTSLQDLRELLHAEPSAEGWFKLCAVLDKTDDAFMEMAIDYIAAGSRAWGGPLPSFTHFPERTPGTPSKWEEQHYHHYLFSGDEPGLEKRVMPLKWQKQLIRREWSPKFNTIRALGFHNVKVNTTLARNILHCPHLQNLEALYLGGRPLTPRFARDLALTDNLPALTHLDLNNVRFAGDGVVELLGQNSLDRLEHLSLGRMELTGHHIVALPANLRALNIYRNRLGRTLDQVVAALPPSLEALDLSLNDINSSSLRRALRDGAMGHLKHLSLAGNPLTRYGIKVLADSPWLDQLEILDLRFTDLTRAGAEYLANAPHFKSLKRLLVHESDSRWPGNEAPRIYSDVAKALLNSPHLSDEVKAGIPSTHTP